MFREIQPPFKAGHTSPSPKVNIRHASTIALPTMPLSRSSRRFFSRGTKAVEKSTRISPRQPCASSRTELGVVPTYLMSWSFPQMKLFSTHTCSRLPPRASSPEMLSRGAVSSMCATLRRARSSGPGPTPTMRKRSSLLMRPRRLSLRWDLPGVLGRYSSPT